MRSVYDYTGSAFKAYCQAKRNKKICASKMAVLALTDSNHYRTCYGNDIYAMEKNIHAFLPYWIALEAKQEGHDISDELIQQRLAKAKTQITTHEKRSIYPYEDAGLDFEIFRARDTSFCDYDRVTYKAVINHRITEEEEKELRDELTVVFHDPYCDGRDCTGAPFTGYIQFLRCSDRTIVLHCIEYDV